jgi:hypothetical protein
MKLRALFSAVSAVLLVLTLACVVPAASKADRLPFHCSTKPWQDSFEVVKTRLERTEKRILWLLKAKKDVRVPAYEAYVADGDGTELATIRVKFHPDRRKFKAGTQFWAELPLDGVDVGEVGRIVIRARR